MSPAEATATTAIIGTVIATVGFVIRNNRAESRRRGRVYERLDEVKANNDKTFVRKDICGERTKNMQADIREIKGDVKKLLLKNGIK